MVTDGWTESSLTLRGNEIPVRTGHIGVGDLQFYTENPRLYSIVCLGDEEPSQNYIQKKLSAMEHVKQLVQSIRANGGLTDPLIVRDGDLVVLEGNSRLAAYRILAENDPIKWGKVKCTLLPKNINDSLVFALLGEYHIIGKKDWAPYEQAGYLYRRFKNHGVDPAIMADEMGLSKRMVGHLIEIYSFMVEHGDDAVDRWSYYAEFLSHHSIKNARRQFPQLDKIFVKKVKSGEIPKAVDVREKFTNICEVGGKTLKSFLTEEADFDRCADRAIARGADNEWYKRLRKFHEQFSEQGIVEIFSDMDESLRKKCQFELKKIRHIVDLLSSKIG
jgi:hypothetical protein